MADRRPLWYLGIASHHFHSTEAPIDASRIINADCGARVFVQLPSGRGLDGREVLDHHKCRACLRARERLEVSRG